MKEVMEQVAEAFEKELGLTTNVSKYKENIVVHKGKGVTVNESIVISTRFTVLSPTKTKLGSYGIEIGIVESDGTPILKSVTKSGLFKDSPCRILIKKILSRYKEQLFHFHIQTGRLANKVF